MKRALISVSDKTGLLDLAYELIQLNFEIISTGGTAKTLIDADIPVTLVSDATGFPEIMEGRVKTLHPKIHGGILGKRDVHQTIAIDHNIRWIDLVVCNLYPFSKTVNKQSVLEECIEQIDIGGPAMIRAAAKNMQWVTVIHDPNDYDEVIQRIKLNDINAEYNKKLAAKAFAHTAQYDAIIAAYLNNNDIPELITLPFSKISNCRYGENPHQEAAVYRNLLEKNPSVLDAKLLQGKPLSYNNYNDAAAALRTVLEYNKPTAVIIKHANPCGVASASNIDDAFQKAWHADNLSAFGGIIALNQTCTATIAKFLISVFIEVIIAPGYDDEALEILKTKPNYRILEQSPWPSELSIFSPKWISGGLLWQTRDNSRLTLETLNFVTKKHPTEDEIAAMQFAWPILKQLKSNAILVAKGDETLGMGMGQVSRIDAVDGAIKKASGKMDGAILASDAFFPFPDSIEKIAQTPIKAIIQPGGSIKDQAIIDACDKYGISMVFTGQRCFNH